MCVKLGFIYRERGRGEWGYGFWSVGFEGEGVWAAEIFGFFRASVGWKEVPLTNFLLR